MGDMDKRRVIVGIDEVGRGPIAGPVTVAAFVIPAIFKIHPPSKKLKLRDSKKLTPRQREEWFQAIQMWKAKGKADFVTMSFPAQKIDQIGISKCIRLAVEKSLGKLGVDHKTPIFLDGGLKAPKEYSNQTSIIKGDEKIPVISLASICAKVTRDSYMRKQSKYFPEHQFYMHKGYGTKNHYESIKKHGITPLHRVSFLRKLT